MSLKDYGKPMKQSHGKGGKTFNKSQKKCNSFSATLSQGLDSIKEAKSFPSLAQTMSFIFFILVYPPSLVYSCIDPNNAVVKSSIGKEKKKCSS